MSSTLEADAAGRRVYLAAFSEGLRPDPLISVSEWADRYRWIAPGASAEPGRYRTARTPYLREIMDSLSIGDATTDVVVMKGAQLGATEAAANFLGYVIDHAPGPTMIVWPRDEDVRTNSRTRVDPMIEASDRLRRKVRAKAARDGGNTTSLKEFPGGILRMVGANSAAGLRSMPVRFLVLDEVDGYPPDVDGEGDPIGLAVRRTSSYGGRAKRLLISTPTVAGTSRIEAAYEDSDQRLFYVPCPECEAYQPLRWRSLRWEDDAPETVRLACEACGCLIAEAAKERMLERGEWRPQNPGHPTRGYHVSALYAPFGMYSWEQAVREFLAAKRSGAPERLKTWVNTVLGETWKLNAEAPDWRKLYDRREEYRAGTVPEGGVVLTAGADVQHDRIEVEVVAWGRRFESWSVAWRTLIGDTSSETKPVWRELAELLDETFEAEVGVGVRVARLAVDASFRSPVVYRWIRSQGGTASGRAIAVRGRDQIGAGVVVGTAKAVERSRRGRALHGGSGGVLVWPVNTGALKEELYSWLRQRPDPESDELPAGWAHFPADYTEEYFRQLCAEQLVTRRLRRAGAIFGREVTHWEKQRDRNEALDARIYARAAAYTLGLDRWQPERWDREEQMLGAARRGVAAGKAPAARKRRKRTDDGFGGRWKGL